MPIFMDRHYLEGATQKDVAEAHQQDLEHQQDYNCNFLTYWFDESRGTAFCLIDAESKENVRQIHGATHGSVPHEIIEVDPMMVEAFLGRMNDPVPIEDSIDNYADSIDPAFRVIMFTDLKDSTAMTAQLGEEKAMHLLRVHNALVRTALREHNGSEVKHTGDGFMVSFRDAAQAISCALDIQLAFGGYNQENPQTPMYVRIGLNAGEPIEESGDLFGSVVQLASRICAHAKPGAVCASKAIQDNCRAEGFHFTDLGASSLKGFSQPVSILQVE